MRPNYWKLLGVAGVAGVAATGVVVARRRRAHTELEPDEIRERLHQRLAEARHRAGDGRAVVEDGGRLPDLPALASRTPTATGSATSRASPAGSTT